jgi:hypothetical protein
VDHIPPSWSFEEPQLFETDHFLINWASPVITIHILQYVCETSFESGSAVEDCEFVYLEGPDGGIDRQLPKLVDCH